MLKRKKATTIKDIARMAGVAHSTVSLVMNDKKHVSPKMREHISRIARQIGYQPNMVARSLISRRFPIVAVVFSGPPRFFTATYSLMIIEGIQRACKRHQCSIMFFTVDHASGESYYEIYRRWLIDLMVIMNADCEKSMGRDIQDLKESRVSFSFVANSMGRGKINCVCVDNFEGVRLALEHLMSLGHNRIGYIGGDLSLPDGRERSEAFKLLVEKLNLDGDEELIVHGDFSFDSGQKKAAELLRLKRPPTAVFAANDYMAMGAMQRIRAGGLSVPRDIAVVGFDNVLEASYIEPRLTTIRQPFQFMGEKAVDLVVASRNEPAVEPKNFLLKPELVIRESCGAAQEP